MESRHWLIALNVVRGLGGVLFSRLTRTFGSPERVFSVPLSQLKEVEGIGAVLSERIVKLEPETEVARELKRSEELGVSILTLEDPDYPRLLRMIDSPPPVLYVKGTLLPADGLAVAVVGSRHPTPYGRIMAERLCEDLVAAGLTIVSGMARGIDSVAHQSALKASGRTLAVLGSGLDRIYPPENRELSEKIAAAGALVSEFSLSTPPEPGNFPARNRLISGLALGTVVVEAAQKSGSLITAQHSLEQGREVFAVPGNANSPASAGANRLIQRGAKLVTSAEDVIEELPEPAKPFLRPPLGGRAQSAGDLEGVEKQIYELLAQGHKHIDDLIIESHAEAGPVSAALASLELKGLVKQYEGKVFARP